MKMTFKKLIAAVMAASTLVVGMTGMSASALTNRYSIISPYKSGLSVYFGANATNKKNSSTDFDYGGQLYNNTNNSFINSVTDREYNVGSNVSVSLRGSYYYSNLPDSTKCKNNVRAYIVYSQYGTPYETYTSDSYYSK